MMVRDRPARSRTEGATTLPVVFSFSHLAGSISNPISGTLASISRADSAVPIRPSPMIPAGTFGCMITSPLSIARLFGFDAGGLGLRRPSGDLAADEAAEFGRRHRRDDHADAGKLFARRRHRQDFCAFAVKPV